MKVIILLIVLTALISPAFIRFGKGLSSIVVLGGFILALIWAYHIYISFLPNKGGYGLGTSIWMFVAFAATYLIFVAVIVLIKWPTQKT